MAQPIVTEIPKSAWRILPPAPGLCQVCAHAHEPGEPHNPQSPYWNTVRASKGEKSATWNEALAHCSEDVRKSWEGLLHEIGVDLDKPGGNPP